MVVAPAEVSRTKVAQFMMLPVSPEVFDGIELWRIRGQPLQDRVSMRLANEVVHPSAPMTGQTVPND